MEIKKKKNIFKSILLGLLVGVLIGGIGTVSYAMFSYSINGEENSTLVAGEIYMKYTESNNIINIHNSMPRDNYDPNVYFDFDITGKNTSSNTIYYEIVLTHGDVPNNKTETNRIADEFLRFRLVDKSDMETDLLATTQYYTIDNNRIYVDEIPTTNSVETTSYRLYMWIDSSVKIGGGLFEADYNESEWSNLFASVKVTVNGDFTPKSLPTYTLITYNSNGGSNWPSKKQIDVSATTYGPLAQPTKDGYTFAGWYTAAEGGTEITSETSYTDGTSTTDLYAHWSLGG